MTVIYYCHFNIIWLCCMIRVMKLLVLAVTVISGIIFYTNIFPVSFALAKSSTPSASILSKPSGILQEVLGIATSTINNYLPTQTLEKFLNDTSSSVVTSVKSDVNQAVSQATNNILASQLITNFKKLPKPIQEQVKQNICK